MHPILCHVGSVTIYSYGVCVALGVLFSWWATRSLATAKSADPAVGTDLLFFAVLGGITGGRIFYVIQHADLFAADPLSALAVHEGGLVWYGGFLGAVLFAWAAARIQKADPILWSGILIAVVPGAHAIGRVGCYLNGCCYGKLMPDGSRFPVQLLEAVLLFVLFLRLRRSLLAGNRSIRVIAEYLMGYGVLRLAVEFFRGDQTIHGGLSLPQWISLALAGAGIALWSRRSS